MRNLDVTALRSLIAVADARGVTRGAERVNLTQSAVSMQIKRLEQQMGHALLQKDGRGVVLTRAGEQLLAYARQIVAINDEAWYRMTEAECADEVRIGVPSDVVYPHVPRILRRTRELMPRLRLRLVSNLTRELKTQFDAGQLDLILATEDRLGAGGETLRVAEQHWCGALGGTARLQEPLPVAVCNHCALLPGIERSLTAARRRWERVSDTDSDHVISALVSADLAITTVLDTQSLPGGERIVDGSLPELESVRINLYATSLDRPSVDGLVRIFRDEFRGGNVVDDAVGPVRLVDGRRAS
ncbi:MAG: LysR family transcriptional regulator [Pseudomonadota bacterium]